MVVKDSLKYLFHVQYYDGGGFIQNKEDVSRTDPTKSAYYDVEQDKVEYFELINPLKDEAIGVDLETGEFFNDHITFYVGDVGLKPYKLIYYRRHTHNFNLGLDEINHNVQYCIGYKDANDVEHVIHVE